MSSSVDPRAEMKRRIESMASRDRHNSQQTSAPLTHQTLTGRKRFYKHVSVESLGDSEVRRGEGSSLAAKLTNALLCCSFDCFWTAEFCGHQDAIRCTFLRSFWPWQWQQSGTSKVTHVEASSPLQCR